MTVSVTWTGSVQWGAYNVGASTWADITPNDVTGDITLITGSVDGGLILDATASQALRTALVGGDTRMLDGPVFATIGGLSLTTTRIAGGAAAVSVEIGVVPEAQPVDFASGSGPWTRNEVSLGNFSFNVTGFPTTALTTFSFSNDAQAALRARLQSSRWNGRVAFSFRSTSAFNFQLKNGPSFLPSLATSQEPFFSGLAGGPYGGPVRVLRDGRYAMPAFTGALVQDGDQPNLWVRPFDADPDDPEQKYRPRPGEGTVSDDVPNP